MCGEYTGRTKQERSHLSAAASIELNRTHCMTDTANKNNVLSMAEFPEPSQKKT